MVNTMVHSMMDLASILPKIIYITPTPTLTICHLMPHLFLMFSCTILYSLRPIMPTQITKSILIHNKPCILHYILHLLSLMLSTVLGFPAADIPITEQLSMPLIHLALHWPCNLTFSHFSAYLPPFQYYTSQALWHFTCTAHATLLLL